MRIEILVVQEQYNHREDVVPIEPPIDGAYLDEAHEHWYVDVESLEHLIQLMTINDLDLLSDRGDFVYLQLECDYSDAPVWKRDNLRRIH